MKPAIHLIRTIFRDSAVPEATPPGYVDDASRLNQTKVAEVWQIPVDSQNPEGQLADLLKRAQADKLRVSVAGARHSMAIRSIPVGLSLI